MTLWQLSNGAVIDVEGITQFFPELGVPSETRVMAAFGLRPEEGDPVEMLLKRIKSVDDPEVLTERETRAGFARMLVHELVAIDPHLATHSPGVCACAARKTEGHDNAACDTCRAWLDAWDCWWDERAAATERELSKLGEIDLTTPTLDYGTPTPDDLGNAKKCLRAALRGLGLEGRKVSDWLGTVNQRKRRSERQAKRTAARKAG